MAAAALKLVMQERRGVLAHAGWCARVFVHLQQGDPACFDGGPAADALIALCGRLRSGEEPLLDTDPACLATVLVLPGVPV